MGYEPNIFTQSKLTAATIFDAEHQLAISIHRSMAVAAQHP